MVRQGGSWIREQYSRNSMCKGPEAGRVPGPQRNWKEARVAKYRGQGYGGCGTRRYVPQGLLAIVLKQLVWTIRGPRNDGGLEQSGGLRRHLRSRVHSDGWDVGRRP